MPDTIDFRKFAGPVENEYVLEWKGNGGRVVGFFCAHAPEELLWAAGLLPLRMRGTGSEDTSHADQYLGPVNCSFVRHTLNRIMSGELDFFDGLLLTNSCDHLRRVADICMAKEAAPFCQYVDVPHVCTPESLGRLIGQLRTLKEKLESFFAVTITEENLAAALRLYNRTRQLLSEVSALRAQDSPSVTGSEVLAMAVAASSMPKDRFNSLLEKRLSQLQTQENGSCCRRPRLLIVGGMLDDPGYLEVIESLGADVVADQLCCGSKSFSAQADETIEPIEAIARRMLDHVPCPRMVNEYPTRVAHIAEAIERYRVDGIICERLKFCDLWAGETHMLRHSAKNELMVPLLALERDYLSASGVGQLRTRVQAFLETLG